MPNWCTNTLTVTSLHPETIQKFKEKADGGDCDLSLQKLYPNPEDCSLDWNRENWGTKWDVKGKLIEEDIDKLVYSFDSAWSPPIEAFQKIVQDFPNLAFSLEYDELGCGFAGEAFITSSDTVIKSEEIHYGLCPKCLEETQLLRGECCLCGAEIDYVIEPIGSILDKSDIVRDISPENS